MESDKCEIAKRVLEQICLGQSSSKCHTSGWTAEWAVSAAFFSAVITHSILNCNQPVCCLLPKLQQMVSGWGISPANLSALNHRADQPMWASAIKLVFCNCHLKRDRKPIVMIGWGTARSGAVVKHARASFADFSNIQPSTLRLLPQTQIA